VPHLSSFRGLVFDAAIVGPLDRVTAPPYDVISDRRRAHYLDGSPFNVVHLDLADGSTDPADPRSRYARAAELLTEWERGGALTRADDPTLYVYEMWVSGAAGVPRTGDGDEVPAARAVRGLICAMELEDWGGTVLPHERVMPGPVDDRLALLRATHTHLSPVYGTVDGPDDRLDDFLRAVASTDTRFETVDEQGVRHRMWPVRGDAIDLDHLTEERLLIADGHHRYTTALRYRDEQRDRLGAGPWDRVLALVVDATAEHLPVLPFHRVQLAGTPPPAVGEPVADLPEAMAALDDDRCTIATVTRDADGHQRYRVRTLVGAPPAVVALHDEVLDALAPEGSLRYLADTAEADATVRRGDAVAAYLLPPTTPDRIRGAVEHGERLPQKSTYFWPKPRTGMVMMPLERDREPVSGRPGRAS
jgi:uncharacterized protein (DUF1015 family)